MTFCQKCGLWLWLNENVQCSVPQDAAAFPFDFLLQAGISSNNLNEVVGNLPAGCLTFLLYLSPCKSDSIPTKLGHYTKWNKETEKDKYCIVWLIGGILYKIVRDHAVGCRSPAPAARDSTWREGRCRWVTTQPLNFLGLCIYFKFKIFFYTFKKALGQRFDIFSSPSPRFIISINHCCPSDFLLQGFSRNQLYHLLSTSS